MKYKYIILFMLFFILNCKKKDYREKYTGKYLCSDSGSTGKYDLNVVKQGDSDGLKIGGAPVVLLEDGYFVNYSYGTNYGYFTKDSLYLGNSNITRCIKLD